MSLQSTDPCFCGMDASYVAEILLEGAAIRPRPWIESPSLRDPDIARIV